MTAQPKKDFTTEATEVTEKRRIEIFLALSPLGERVASVGAFFSPSADGDG